MAQLPTTSHQSTRCHCRPCNQDHQSEPRCRLRCHHRRTNLGQPSLFSQTVSSSTYLADHAQLVVLLQPVGSINQAIGKDRAVDTCRARAGAIGVEVLVHLVDELVLRVRQSAHCFSVGQAGRRVDSSGPCPCTRVGVAFRLYAASGT